MKLYHGSNVEVKEPNILVGRRTLDFGQGFYTTSDYNKQKNGLLIFQSAGMSGNQLFLCMNLMK
jgi:hypothetical protein